MKLLDTDKYGFKKIIQGIAIGRKGGWYLYIGPWGYLHQQGINSKASAFG